jgi:hypothetical protein
MWEMKITSILSKGILCFFKASSVVAPQSSKNENLGVLIKKALLFLPPLQKASPQPKTFKDTSIIKIGFDFVYPIQITF